MENLKHIQVPSDKTSEKVTPKDLLVYCVLKENENWETHETFVGLETVGKKLGISTPTVRKSLKALEEDNYIEIIRRKGKPSIYKFNPYKQFEGFSPEFLENSNLSVSEKAYLIAVQKLMRTDDGLVGKVSYSNKQIADKLNISERNIYNIDKSLQNKNYLTIVDNKMRDLETGCATKTKIFDLNSYGQQIVFLLKAHHQAIADTIERQDAIEQKQNAMEKRIELLEQMVKDKNTVIEQKNIALEQKDKENIALKNTLHKIQNKEQPQITMD